MGLFSFCRSVGSAISRGASALYNKAKEVAGEAIGWMAEKAEGFVQSTKAAWQVVKPYVQKAQEFIRAAAAVAPLPWLKSALLALDRGLTALFAFENSPIAKKIDSAIKWAIELAKRWQASRQKAQSAQQHSAEQEEELTDEELAIAQKHQATFRSIEIELDDAQARETCELAASINDFKIAKTLLAKALEGDPADFEHYLRLRATQKLLKMADATFQNAKTIDDIGTDVLFLVRTASNLVKANPELSMAAAKKLDVVLKEQYGTTLAPFVFEEMVGSWGAMAKDLNAQWAEANKKRAKMNVAFKSLTLNKQLQGHLAPDEEEELTRLQIELPVAQTKLHDLDIQRNDIARYVGAIEGFLQLLEKSQEEIEANGHSYLLKDGAKVGMILMRCAQEGLAFNDLELDEQDLITDYANIFSAEADVRMERVLEIAV
ncbi:hypothetical protein ACEUAY_01840 [Aeromonas veronii]|uniref:hypothetical protein n=1 Tax=Aeromonas veronii TaxID=654 RepID=UPI001BCEC6B1|nr:hypothetical protein [Aeromonas veronii]MBS4724536.1 hypothetical protein [Aeromonas veronii]MCF5725947.1 hypothetical protein [Aeromonas veronii]